MEINHEKVDLVWARMRYCNFWPARVVETPPQLGRTPIGKVCVLFFGTKQFGFVDSNKIKPYLEHREKNVKIGRGADFADAVRKMDEYISDPKKFKSNAYAKPILRRIQIKREPQKFSPLKIKKEAPKKNDAASIVASNVQGQLETLTREKNTLIDKVVSLKTENQKMLLELKNEQSQNEALKLKKNELEQQVNAQASEINILQQKMNAEIARCAEKSANDDKKIFDMVYDKKMLEARVEQLQAGIMNKEAEQQSNPDVYDVESLVGHKVQDGVWFYLVHWHGYDSTNDTWERESNLYCTEILDSYKKSIQNEKREA